MSSKKERKAEERERAESELDATLGRVARIHSSVCLPTKIDLDVCALCSQQADPPTVTPWHGERGV